MSKKHWILLGWIDSIQADTKLTFGTIDDLYELYSSSNDYSEYPVSMFGFRRIINQIIELKMNKYITKSTRRTNCRNITSYFISSQINNNDEQNERYIRDQSNIDDCSSMRPSNSYTGIQLSPRHNRSMYPNVTPSIVPPSVTSPAIISPSLVSPSLTSPSIMSPSHTSPSNTPPSVTSPSNTSSPSSTNIQPPILSKLNGSIEDTVNSALTEVVNYFKHHNCPIEFTYTSNMKKGLLVNIPIAKSKTLFNKYQKRTSWLEPMLSHINRSSPSEATEWLIELLRSFCSYAFEKVCERYGYGKNKQLDTVATAAM